MKNRYPATALLFAVTCMTPALLSTPAHAESPAALKATPQGSDAAPVLISSAQWQRMAKQGAQLPLFAKEEARLTTQLRKTMAAGIHVPVPKDAAGGYTHEQHKRNYEAIKAAGTLYRLTGDKKYADFARDMLLQYARLYPTLGRHPAGHGDDAGKLFWQTLNDSVWLVNAIQGYDAIRDTLSEKDRRDIDNNVFRRMAHFLTVETPKNFDQIHNHATWAAAGVGMTGFVLRDPKLVKMALLGLHEDGKFGFLQQLHQLYSPDGYYREGPYYGRYAMAPYMIFASVLQQDDPQLKIFERHGGALLKAVDALVQSSYAGFFFPLDDSLRDKGLNSEELVYGIATTYALTHDPRLLSIAQGQGRTVLTPGGLEVSEALQAGKAKPFDFHPILLRDGPKGQQGAMAILRMGGNDGQTLVMKNTAMGMGHGHFDKLNWLFYDNGQAVVTDYGSARFINIEPKDGGRYTPENTSWAKQTIAHNTLVVNETSDYGGKWRVGETNPPRQLLFAVTGNTQISSARMDGAYKGVNFTRTLALLKDADLSYPIAIDLLRVHGDKPARYDLPLHYAGHIMQVGFDMQQNLTERPVLGKANGYQHLWVDATSAPNDKQRTFEWMLGGRFYSYRFAASAPTSTILAQLGANDPDFDLRRPEVLIQRMDGQRDATFFSVLEPHGMYDNNAEITSGESSRIENMARLDGNDAQVIVLTLAGGKTLALGVADDPSDSTTTHHVSGNGYDYRWTGGWARFDARAGTAKAGSDAKKTP